MTDKKEPLKIVFAPGCFDNFDGTQEELDAFMAELEQKISTMTPEELEAESTQIDEDYIDELFETDPEAAAKLVNILLGDTAGENRTLQ